MGEVTLTRKHRSSKMEGGSAVLADTFLSASGNTDHADVFGYLIRTLEIINGATESVVFTVEGGFKRPDGTATEWHTLATRADSSAAFATTARTVLASAKAIYEISPTPVTHLIRVAVSDGNATAGTDFYLYVEV